MPRKTFIRHFFGWYNRQPHHHVGIGLMTPDQVHYGQAAKNSSTRVRKSSIAPSRPTQNASSNAAKTAEKTYRRLDQPATQREEIQLLKFKTGCLKIVDTLRHASN